MAFKITYTYKKQAKEIGYANDKFRSIYDAIAAAEGLDLGFSNIVIERDHLEDKQE